jgi:hypothetical protein
MYEGVSRENFLGRSHQGTYAMNIIKQAIDDAYDRLAHPQIVRLIR